MSNIAKPEEIKIYKYRIAELIAMIGGENIVIPSHSVTEMNITHDFENAIYPVFRLAMNITTNQYYSIMQNKNTVKFKLRIQKYYCDPDGQNPSLMRDWLNATFTLILDEEADTIQKNAPDTKWSSYSSEAEKQNCSDEFFFYRDEVATAMKTVVNNVMSGENLTNAINYTCSEAGISNMIISPLENQKTYSQLILPPLTVPKELQHLDSQYGFYKNGAVIYFGLKNSYVLNFKGGCTAYQQGESQQTNFIVLAPNQNESMESGMIMKNDGHSNIHWKITDLQINNESVTNDVVGGNNVTVVDTSTTSITKTQSSAVTKGPANTQVIKNDTENAYLSTTLTAQNNAAGDVITGSISNIDLDAITPNKKFTLIFEDTQLASKYKGIYMPMQEEIHLSTSGGVDFDVVVGLTIKRVAGKGTETTTTM